MRALVLLFLLAGCADPYGDAQKVDTIEAWEGFLAGNPSGSEKLGAEKRLEELLVARAEQSKKVEDYDAVLKKFPKSRKTKEMQAGRANAAFAVAEAEGTADAWKAFLDENPTADTALKKKARNMVAVAEYKDKLAMTEPKVEEVNLAEDPKGPKDGWGFTTVVTNDGDKAVEYLNLEVQFLDAQGQKLKAFTYPLAAQAGPGGLPLPEEYTKPLEPGQSRTWTYTTGDVPEGWSKQVKVVPVAVRFVGTPAKEGASEEPAQEAKK